MELIIKIVVAFAFILVIIGHPLGGDDKNNFS